MAAKLIKRGGTYSARYVVPTRYRALLGRETIVRTTGTGDLREAEKRKYRILADIQDDVERQVRNSESNMRHPRWITAAAAELVKQMGKTSEYTYKGKTYSSTMDEDDVAELLDGLIEEHLTARGEDFDDLTDSHKRTLRSAFTITGSGDTMSLSVAIDRHLSEKTGRVNESTISRQRMVLDGFAEWAGDPDVSAVTRRVTGRWVSEILLPMDMTPKTKEWYLSALSSFFNWMIRKGLYESANPWAGMGRDIKGTKRGSESNGGRKRRPWTDDELKNLADLSEDDPTHAVTRLCLYAGLRTEEACSLKVADVNSSLAAGLLSRPLPPLEQVVNPKPRAATKHTT